MVSKRLITGGVGSLVLNLVLLVLLTGLAVMRFQRTERKNYKQVHKCEIAGAVKQMLSMGTLVGYSQTSADITRVNEDLLRIYNEEGNLKKPALHLTISRENDITDDVPVLSWQTSPNTSYVGEGVNYEDGAVSVTHGGYYFIYSTIRYSGDGTAELDYGRILHSVLMKKESEREESPTILMQNLQSTPTIRRGRQAYVTSTLGATFYLPPNSKIMVTSSIPGNIDTSPCASYVGLFFV